MRISLSSWWNCVSFLSFSCLTEVIRPSRTVLTTRNERGHHYLIIDLGGENIQCLTMKYDAHCRFLCKFFVKLRTFPSLLLCWKSLSWIGVLVSRREKAFCNKIKSQSFKGLTFEKVIFGLWPSQVFLHFYSFLPPILRQESWRARVATMLFLHFRGGFGEIFSPWPLSLCYGEHS